MWSPSRVQLSLIRRQLRNERPLVKLIPPTNSESDLFLKVLTQDLEVRPVETLMLVHDDAQSEFGALGSQPPTCLLRGIRQLTGHLLPKTLAQKRQLDSSAAMMPLGLKLLQSQ